jgi:hypothetical protein
MRKSRAEVNSYASSYNDLNPEYVVEHAARQRQRHRNPSLPYRGIKNPRNAALLAHAELENLKLTPHLKEAGWLPDVYWVASTPEQQHDLDMRYKAEKVAHRVHDSMAQLKLKKRKELKPHEREQSVRFTLQLIAAQESYKNRQLSEILRDTVSWIEEAKEDSDGHYNLRHTLEREADSLLRKVAEDDEVKAEVDPKLLELSLQWAAIEFFSYRYYRDWDVDDHTPESTLELFEKVGIPKEDFFDFGSIFIDDEAQRLHAEEGYAIHGANQSVIENRILDRAKELDTDTGLVHNYSNYLTAWGI